VTGDHRQDKQPGHNDNIACGEGEIEVEFEITDNDVALPWNGKEKYRQKYAGIKVGDAAAQ